jgi:hypothetical protein
MESCLAECNHLEDLDILHGGTDYDPTEIFILHEVFFPVLREAADNHWRKRSYTFIRRSHQTAVRALRARAINL